MGHESLRDLTADPTAPARSRLPVPERLIGAMGLTARCAGSEPRFCERDRSLSRSRGALRGARAGHASTSVMCWMTTIAEVPWSTSGAGALEAAAGWPRTAQLRKALDRAEQRGPRWSRPPSRRRASGRSSPRYSTNALRGGAHASWRWHRPQLLQRAGPAATTFPLSGGALGYRRRRPDRRAGTSRIGVGTARHARAAAGCTQEARHM